MKTNAVFFLSLFSFITILPIKAQVEYQSISSTPSAEENSLMDSLECVFAIDRMIRFAERFQGVPYVWAANGPDSFDCSGFVHYVYSHAGYKVKRNSKLLSQEGRDIAIVEVKKGDLVFFVSGVPPERDVSHVGIAISDYDPETRNFQFIHANKRDNCVAISNYNEQRFRNSSGGARRVIACLDR